MRSYQPHDNEAAGAVEGMAETYGRKFIPEGVAVGQQCTIQTDEGEQVVGFVVERDEADRHYRITQHIPGRGRVLHYARFDQVSPF